MTAEELNAYLPEVFPQIVDQYADLEIIDVGAGTVTVALTTNDANLRPGGTVSGPTLFALADLGGYACALSHIGRQALTVTTNLNINFMRKAEAGRLLGHCRILKLGKRLMVFDCDIRQADEESGSIAHATGTYAIPPADFRQK
ncbi:thioesterase superfamily protein [Ahrensia sp. R2A130]|nr:thioesterase superfamily protein [Ahrensia sp. R2A130]